LSGTASRGLSGLALTAPVTAQPGRYRPADKVLAFLDGLRFSPRSHRPPRYCRAPDQSRSYPSCVPVNQYVYFALSSHDTSAAEMTAVLGMEPDETTVRGSRITQPSPVPVIHRWKIVCREPGLRVDEQIAHVLERLAPHTQAIAALVGRLDAEFPQGPSAVLEVVRYFNREAGQQDRPARRDTRPEAPNMFGWHLDRGVLDFLHTTGAVLDIDEYDMTPDRAEDQPGP
jgi:Domain of unknown function (DUF4279)